MQIVVRLKSNICAVSELIRIGIFVVTSVSGNRDNGNGGTDFNVSPNTGNIKKSEMAQKIYFMALTDKFLFQLGKDCSSYPIPDCDLKELC